MTSLYGNLVTLSNFRMEGARPDGSVYPGADLLFIVDFDQVGAGCTANEVCSPGADISWYVNGQYAKEGVGAGYSEGYGYSQTFGMLAPASGTVTVMAKSLNQVTATFTVVGQGLEPSAGQVMVKNVTCGTGPDYQCSCESNGELVVYFTKVVTAAGQGVAYVDVLIDNNLVMENAPTSTAQSGGMDSVAVSCPSDGQDHVIAVRGKNDAGASVILRAGTPLGGSFVGGFSGTTIQIGSGLTGTPNNQNLIVPTGSPILTVAPVTSVPGAGDNTILWVAGGVAAIVGGALVIKYLAGRMSGARRYDELAMFD